MPIDESVALRLHEVGQAEDHARLAYVLCVSLNERERWLARGFKRPQELMRWGLAGIEDWGLADEFEPMRRLARAEQWVSLAEGARGRFNEVMASRLSHVRSIGFMSPRTDHVYWLMVVCALALGMWGGYEFGNWMGATKGLGAQVISWLGGSALLALCLKSAAYVWQDSSTGLAAGMGAMVWGPSPREDALRAMSSHKTNREDSELEASSGPQAARLIKKAKRGDLSALEALELAQASKKAKSWRENWAAAQDRWREQGKSIIESSLEPGWAMAQLERLELGKPDDRGQESQEPSRSTRL